MVVVTGCNIKTVILDEADILLSKGKNDIEHLLDMYVNWTTQIIAFCSEMSEDVLEFKEKRMADSVRVITGKGMFSYFQQL